MTDRPTDPRAEIWSLIRGFWRICAANAWVRLRCPDHLADSPLTIDELARRCQAHAPTLARLTRAMASLGHVTIDTDGTCALTDVGATLRDDAPGSMRPGILLLGENLSWTVMGGLDEIVRTGTTPVITEHGSIYDYYSTRPELESAFARFMVARSQTMAEGMLGAHDFTGARTLVDVGGGAGTILAAVLRAHPGLRGTLLDIPTMAPAARAYLDEQGVGDRSDVIGGDFLTEVPAGADRYLLANIVHNWPDHTAVKILDTVRAAMTEHSRLLLLDFLLADDPSTPDHGAELDMRMIALFGEGQERTRDAYTGLLEQAGLRVLRTTPLTAGPHLIEAARA